MRDSHRLDFCEIEPVWARRSLAGASNRTGDAEMCGNLHSHSHKHTPRTDLHTHAHAHASVSTQSRNGALRATDVSLVTSEFVSVAQRRKRF